MIRCIRLSFAAVPEKVFLEKRNALRNDRWTARRGKKSGVEHQIKRDKLPQPKTISPQKSTQGLKEMSRVAYPYTGSGANYNSELINKGIFEVNKNQIGLN